MKYRLFWTIILGLIAGCANDNEAPPVESTDTLSDDDVTLLAPVTDVGFVSIFDDAIDEDTRSRSQEDSSEAVDIAAKEDFIDSFEEDDSQVLGPAQAVVAPDRSGHWLDRPFPSEELQNEEGCLDWSVLPDAPGALGAILVSGWGNQASIASRE